MASPNIEQDPLPLASFGSGVTAAVFGASGGIGAALAAELEASPAVDRLYRLSRRPAADSPEGPWLAFDLEDETSIAEAAARLRAEAGTLDLVIVATGLLHRGEAVQPEKTWRNLEPASLEANFRLNAIGPALVAKHLLPLLTRERKVAFAAISARVGSISDNELGGWYGYRASKAALNMLLKTLSIELARRSSQALCVGLHPGTVDTALSQPFQGAVPDGKLFTPQRSARHLLTVLDGLTPSDTGKVFAWDGAEIPA